MSDTLPSARRRFGRGRLALAAAALVAVGGGAGALAVNATRPGVTMAPATPVAIRTLTDDSIVTVRGRVAEIFGNKFVMADATGRALVDLGREGDDGDLVAAGQVVTVQGRFDHGSIRASFLVKPDGKVTALGPLHGPGHDRHDRRDGPGKNDRRGPPPAPAAVSAPAPAATPAQPAATPAT